MASEKDFELLDNYLSNRMSGHEKEAFEQKIQSDPELKQELTIQQTIAEGIRNARTAELKSMLNNIPVTPVNGGQTSILIKAGAWAVITSLVITGVYFYFTDKESTEEAEQTSPVTLEQPEVKTPVEPAPAEETNPEAAKPAEEPVKKTEKTSVPKQTDPAVTSAPSRPGVKVYDPSKEEKTDEAVEKYEQEQLEIISKAFVTSSIEVETENTNKKYSFHYVFKDGKLVLFGAFEKHLYEILEFISNDKRTVVLFYRNNYYLLDINKSTPTLLSPIRDKALLKKLGEYRGN